MSCNWTLIFKFHDFVLDYLVTKNKRLGTIALWFINRWLHRCRTYIYNSESNGQTVFEMSALEKHSFEKKKSRFKVENDLNRPVTIWNSPHLLTTSNIGKSLYQNVLDMFRNKCIKKGFNSTRVDCLNIY